MMVLRIRDISFTWGTDGKTGRAALGHGPPHPRPARAAHPHLVSDVIPQLHQDLVEQGELGDQGLGLLPCQDPGRGEAQNQDASPGPSLGHRPAAATAAPSPPQSLGPAPGPLASFPSPRPTHRGWSGARWSLEGRRKPSRGRRVAGTRPKPFQFPGMAGAGGTRERGRTPGRPGPPPSSGATVTNLGDKSGGSRRFI